jgi:hypothetical protein
MISMKAGAYFARTDWSTAALVSCKGSSCSLCRSSKQLGKGDHDEHRETLSRNHAVERRSSGVRGRVHFGADGARHTRRVCRRDGPTERCRHVASMRPFRRHGYGLGQTKRGRVLATAPDADDLDLLGRVVDLVEDHVMAMREFSQAGGVAERKRRAGGTGSRPGRCRAVRGLYVRPPRGFA